MNNERDEPVHRLQQPEAISEAHKAYWILINLPHELVPEVFRRLPRSTLVKFIITNRILHNLIAPILWSRIPSAAIHRQQQKSDEGPRWKLYIGNTFITSTSQQMEIEEATSERMEMYPSMPSKNTATRLSTNDFNERDPRSHQYHAYRGSSSSGYGVQSQNISTSTPSSRPHQFNSSEEPGDYTAELSQITNHPLDDYGRFVQDITIPNAWFMPGFVSPYIGYSGKSPFDCLKHAQNVHTIRIDIMNAIRSGTSHIIKLIQRDEFKQVHTLVFPLFNLTSGHHALHMFITAINQHGSIRTLRIMDFPCVSYFEALRDAINNVPLDSKIRVLIDVRLSIPGHAWLAKDLADKMTILGKYCGRGCAAAVNAKMFGKNEKRNSMIVDYLSFPYLEKLTMEVCGCGDKAFAYDDWYPTRFPKLTKLKLVLKPDKTCSISQGPLPDLLTLPSAVVIQTAEALATAAAATTTNEKSHVVPWNHSNLLVTIRRLLLCDQHIYTPNFKLLQWDTLVELRLNVPLQLDDVTDGKLFTRTPNVQILEMHVYSLPLGACSGSRSNNPSNDNPIDSDMMDIITDDYEINVDNDINDINDSYDNYDNNEVDKLVLDTITAGLKLLKQCDIKCVDSKAIQSALAIVVDVSPLPPPQTNSMLYDNEYKATSTDTFRRLSSLKLSGFKSITPRAMISILALPALVHLDVEAAAALRSSPLSQPPMQITNPNFFQYQPYSPTCTPSALRKLFVRGEFDVSQANYLMEIVAKCKESLTWMEIHPKTAKLVAKSIKEIRPSVRIVYSYDKKQNV
ncbi:hypothetical protein GQ42DRAFT_82658 [Ramicandelaber brevisporus]|nr:hypothetical protein GQ42DRAFT_82658 [Ramicandelaber brevisporus]